MPPPQAALRGAESAEGVGVWGRGVPSAKKIFADLSWKEAILKHFKMIISLLCFNTIVNIIKVLKTNFLKPYILKIKPAISSL